MLSSSIVSLKRVSDIHSVFHGREDGEDEFFFVYMTFFIQLHFRLPFNKFTIGVLRLLNITQT